MMPWSDWITDPDLRIHTVPRDRIEVHSVQHTNAANTRTVSALSHRHFSVYTPWIYFAERHDPKSGFIDQAAWDAAYATLANDMTYLEFWDASGEWQSGSVATQTQEVRVRCEWQIFPPLGPCDARWMIRSGYVTIMYDLTINYPIQWYPGGPSGKLSFTQRLPDYIDTLTLGSDISQAPNGQYVEFEAGHSNNPAEFASLTLQDLQGTGSQTHNNWNSILSSWHEYYEDVGYPFHTTRPTPWNSSADVYLVPNSFNYWNPDLWVGVHNPYQPDHPSLARIWRWPWRIPDSGFTKVHDGMSLPLHTVYNFESENVIREPHPYTYGPYTGSTFYNEFISPDEFGCVTLCHAPPGFNKSTMRLSDSGAIPTLYGYRPRTPIWMEPEPCGVSFHSPSDTLPASGVPRARLLVKVRTPPYRYWIPDPVTPPPEDVPPRTPRPPLRLVSRTSKQLSDQRRVGENSYW